MTTIPAENAKITAMRPKYIAGGLLTLLISSYLDAVRGALLPVLNRALGITYGQSSWLLVAGNFASVAALFLLIPTFPRLGARRVTFFICAFGAFVSALGWWVTDFPRLVVFGILMGCLIAAAGAICNLLVIEGTDLVRRARFMCALHTMYGFGCLISPAAAAALLGAGFGWPWVFAVGMPLFAGLALFSLSLGGAPLEDAPAPARKPDRMGLLEWTVIVTFVFYVAAEVLTSMWMVPYLVEVRMLDVITATRYLSGFFLMMGLSRLFCFASLKPHHETIVLFGALLLYGVAFALGHAGHDWAWPLTGVVGPFYPLFLARASRRFALNATHVTLAMLTACQLSLAVAHLFVGRLADRLGIARTYLLPLALMTLAFAGVYFYREIERKPSTA